MNEQHENVELDTPTEESPSPTPESPPPPEPVTKDDLREIVQELIADLNPRPPAPNLEEDPLAGYDPKFADDIRRLMAQQAQAIHAEYSPILMSSVASQAVNQVAADYSPATKNYISDMVARMDPQVAKAMISDPNGIDMLETLAFGFEAKTNKSAKIPRTTEPSGGEDDLDPLGVDSAGLESFMLAFGVDRKRATELYRVAARQSR